MDSGLKGKKALITGGSTGIGLGIAEELAKEGVDIAIASRNPDPEALEKIRAHGVRALRLCADVSQEPQVVRMVKEAIDGLEGLDLYINNSAAHWDEPVTKVTVDGWLNTINTNLSACVFACREVARHFIAQGQGSILIVGSTAICSPLPTETAYRAAKVGLKAYMEVLATEMAPFGIRVNMITPGFYITRLTTHLSGDKLAQVVATIPLRRPGDVSRDIGPSAVLLLSDRLSPYTTGANLVVAGGAQMRHTPYYSYEETRQMNL